MQISSKILFVACCLPACNLCNAQVSALSVYYDYDAAGNCVSRDIILSRSNAPEEKEKVNAFSEMLDELNVTYSPNPTQGILNVSVSGIRAESGSARIFDMSGSILIEYPLSDIMSFDLSSFTAGIYLLNISCGDAARTVRIIKE